MNKHNKAARRGLLGAVLVVSLTLAVALAQDAVTRDASAINLGTGDVGSFLTDAAGMALYLYTPDAQGPSTCYDACAEAWPPVTVESADALPTAGEGVMADMFGTVERDDGTLQLTFNNWPLYYFANDLAAGDTNGQGLNDVWFLVSDAGEALGASE